MLFLNGRIRIRYFLWCQIDSSRINNPIEHSNICTTYVNKINHTPDWEEGGGGWLSPAFFRFF